MISRMRARMLRPQLKGGGSMQITIIYKVMMTSLALGFSLFALDASRPSLKLFTAGRSSLGDHELSRLRDAVDKDTLGSDARSQASADLKRLSECMHQRETEGAQAQIRVAMITVSLLVISLSLLAHLWIPEIARRRSPSRGRLRCT